MLESTIGEKLTMPGSSATVSIPVMFAISLVDLICSLNIANKVEKAEQLFL
jgi:hypothetical protein